MEPSATSPSSTATEDRSPLVLSVIKAFGLLESIAMAQNGLSLGDMSKLNELHPSTAHRLVHTLMEIGYVRQDERSRRYHLGTSVRNLAAPSRPQLDLQAVALPHMQRLSEQIKEAVNLYVLDGIEIINITQAVAPSALQIFTHIGARMPIYCTAGGKALLANLPAQQCEILLQALKLEPHTPNTITQQEEFSVELDRIRRRDYAVDDEEQEVGMRCIAAVVRNAEKLAVAAVSISGPSGRLSMHRFAELAHRIQDTAQLISADLSL